MSTIHYQDQMLYIENVSLSDIADKFGTPCYVYSKKTIEENWQSFNEAFLNVPHRICYAVKANSNLAILNLLVKLGSSFDIVSVGEFERVIKAGGNPKNIFFSGVGKSKEELEYVISRHIGCIDIESEGELERVQAIASKNNIQVNIAIRVNPNIDPETHSHISTGLKENKFGINIDDVIPLCKRLPSFTSLKLVGLAFHIGSQMTNLEPILQATDKMITLYKELKSQNIKISHLNIGGGLGITYRDETPPSVEDYVKSIKSKLQNIPIEIIIEPGRAIVGNAGVLLTRVEYLKHMDHINFAIVDAGMNDFLRPALYNAWQPVLSVREGGADKKQYNIAGPVCESADILAKDRELSLKENDIIAIGCAGAYGFSMSSNYNSRCKSAEVLVDNRHTHLIRKRETLSDLFAHETIPTSLLID